MDWTGLISNVLNNILGVSRMTVCSSPDLEALRLLSGKEGNFSSGETESESEGRGGLKLGSCQAVVVFSPSLYFLSWLRVSRSRLLLSSSGGQRYLAQCGELSDHHAINT